MQHLDCFQRLMYHKNGIIASSKRDWADKDPHFFVVPHMVYIQLTTNKLLLLSLIIYEIINCGTQRRSGVKFFLN